MIRPVILIAFVASLVSSQSTEIPTSTIIIGDTTVAPLKNAKEANDLITDENNGVFSRLVIANKKLDEEHWGLTFQGAENACQEMVSLIHQTSQEEPTEENAEIRTIVDRMLGDHLHEISGTNAINLDGHLVAIHSKSEYDLLGSFFSRLPSDIYWTGGKLVRYRTNSRKSNNHKMNLVLTWTDGTTSDPFELGIDETEANKLSEGQTYCLAINTVNNQWQARNCDDHLAYACLLQHSHDSTTMGVMGADAADMSTGITETSTTLANKNAEDENMTGVTTTIMP